VRFYCSTNTSFLQRILLWEAKHFVLSRRLRSSDINLLSLPRVRACFSSRSFAVAAPTIWNTLPLDIRNSPSMCCFKTYFYNLALGHVCRHRTPCVVKRCNSHIRPCTPRVINAVRGKMQL